MSEKLYALLLRLYPTRFRNRYGEESVQLLRDRLRDEAGVLAKLRLWLDLLTDLAISVPREHRAARPALGAAVTTLRVDGMPSFSVLDEQPPRPGAMMVAVLLSAAGLVTFFVLIDIAGTRHVLRHSQQDFAQNQAAPNQVVQDPVSQSQAAQDPSSSSTASAVPLDPAERRRVASAVATDVETYYFDRGLGREAAQTVLRKEQQGEDDALTGAEFAVLLTRQIRSATGDLHLIVEYSAANLPQQPDAQPSQQALAAYRTTMLENHCAVERTTILPGNIGYLKLNALPTPSVCGPQMRAALASIDNTEAVVFDLRDNRGGDPDMVALVASYLFAQPQPWYNPRDPQPSQLPAPAPGSHLAQKPVYILTSVLTLSGAEQFTYNLKMLHRATLVGETTGGAAHAGVFHRIDDHFGIGIPQFRIINPYSGRDWEGAGVEPDVKVKAADALVTAEKLAEARVHSDIPPR